ncbi:MAG: hypothetical protein JW993_06680 [Sedimentisphaerales bacterium]|nr:hypothetical protein [Sedimentisphaerales bacterium]
MRLEPRYILAVAVRVVLLIPAALALTGCQARPVEWPELGQERSSPATSTVRRSRSALRIEPVVGQEVADLSPDDVVRVAKRIGFTDQQVLDLGADLHNALLLSGAARVLVRDRVEALLRVHGGHVLISSRTRGNHVYNLARGGWGVGPSRPSR